MRFSRRSAAGYSTNAIAARLRLARQSHSQLCDLSQSNPSRCGFGCEPATLALLGDERASAYQPDAQGLPEARQAVADYYRDKHCTVDPGRILLTASTSEAYRLLFDLFCDPGDSVLLPRPAYPLLGILAEISSLSVSSYALIREDAWRLDMAAVEAQLQQPKVQAMVLVHPGNPTGSYVARDEAQALIRLCQTNGVALLVDEVFVDYPLEASSKDKVFSFSELAAEGPCFVLSGLSKVALLPQLKLSWLVANGTALDEVMRRIELMADTFLSTATPVQWALPQLLRQAPRMRGRVVERLQNNLATLDAMLAAQASSGLLRRLPVAGGWYALVEVPRTRSDEAWVLAGIEAGFYLHPGYFYDMDQQGMMVLSLLTAPAVFRQGIERAIALWEQVG